MTEKKTRKPRAKKLIEQQTTIHPELPLETITPLDQNRLTLDDIVQSDKEFDDLQTVTFDNGKYTQIYKKFRPLKIDEMLEDFSNFMVDYEKTGRVIKEKEVQNYLNLHIIQHFSTLVEKFPVDIYEKLDIFEQMLNNELVEKVAESFDKKEIDKVHKSMVKRFEQVQEMMENDKNLKKQLREKISEMNLENREIIEKVMFGEDENGHNESETT